MTTVMKYMRPQQRNYISSVLLKRYMLDGMGNFYLISTGERILYTKEAVGFINQMLKRKISETRMRESISRIQQILR